MDKIFIVKYVIIKIVINTYTKNLILFFNIIKKQIINRIKNLLNAF
jgi:hypothetical protein